MSARNRDRAPRHDPAILDPAIGGKKVQALPVQIASASLVSSVPAVTAGPVPLPMIARGQGRRALRFWVEGGDRVMIGGRDVTPANGIPIQPDVGFLEEMAPDAEWYCVQEVGAAPSTVRIQVLS